MSFRRAVLTLFAFGTLLPLTVFFFYLWRFELVGRAEVHLGLLLALLISLIGFLLSQRMVDRVSRLARFVDARQTPGGPKVEAVVPGLGQLDEIRGIADAVGRMLGDLRLSTERLEDLAFKLATLNETVEVVARIPEMKDLLAVVLERCMRAVRATTASIMLLDRERQALRIAASRGLPAELAATVRVKVGEGIAGKVVHLGEPVLVDNIETDSRFETPNDPKYGSGSFICSPIRVEDRIIGVINLAKGMAVPPDSTPFSPTDLQFLNTLMSYVGYALNNARLLEDSRETAGQLQETVDNLKATQAQLVRSEALRALGELTSGLAHHLNNLLAVVAGRLQIALPRLEDAETRRSLGIAERAARDAGEVIRRVWTFAQGEPASDVVPVDLVEVAREVLEMTRPRWQDEAQLRGIQITVSLDAAEVPLVAGESASLREVLMTLLLNAVDALPGGGQIDVRIWPGEQRVHCSVADTGTGMPEEVRQRVLEPFFTTKGPNRMGLGLNVAYGIIQRYGGELVIESSKGHGTKVTFSLPVARAHRAEPDPPEARVTGDPLRVLVIDDEQQLRAVLTEFLAGDGHPVIEAASGQSGLALLEAGESVDLVLTDLGMPGMNGWEVAQAIKARWPTLPVGVITGWGTGVKGPKDVDFTIAKPFTPEKLRAALDYARMRRSGGQAQ